MKRVIQFSKARYLFFIFSALLILIGIAGYIVNHGFNLGVDFKAGIAFQYEVAPASFALQYDGPDSAEVSLPAGEKALTSAGDIIITITNAKNGQKTDYPFQYAAFKTIKDLTDAIVKVPGITVQPRGDMSVVPTELLPLPRPANITGKQLSLNLSPGAGRGVLTNITEMRAMLTPLGQYDLQAVGNPANQEFIVRMPALKEDPGFQAAAQQRLLDALGTKFSADQIIIKSTEFVGPRMAQSLATQTIWLVLIAVALILVYMMLRFRPPIYAIAAVLGIIHDAIVMLAFDAVFRVEVDAGTIAAILTILGYSINDTIVNFDRARENNTLMRGTSLRSILDTSVTQNLSRTFITSGATMLTVVALFILTSGSIRNFSLNMIVGIVEGTYSTFISAFFVIEWSNWRDRRAKRRELEKYGIHAGQKPASELLAEEADVAEAQTHPEAGEDVEPLSPTALSEHVASAESEPEPVGAGTPAASAGIGVPGAQSASAAPNGQAAQAAPQHTPSGIPSGAPVSAGAQPGGGGPLFRGHSGSRKQKKHKKRHH